MYTYYKKVETEEHMLFAEELYEMYKHLLGDKKATYIHVIIREYLKLCNIIEEPLYFKTMAGLKRVYKVSIAHVAIMHYINNRRDG